VARAAATTPRVQRDAPPRLVLRFAICTGIGLAVAAAAILLVFRHYNTVQAERAATSQARVLAATVLRGTLSRSDFRATVAGARRAELDRVFTADVLDEGVLLAKVLRADGTVTYSTDHRLIGSKERLEHLREARAGAVRGDVTTLALRGTEPKRVLRTYAPVAIPGGIGVVVLFQDYAPIARAAEATFLPVAGIFEAVLVLLFLLLVPILIYEHRRAREFGAT
jgi:hypothetical protein